VSAKPLFIADELLERVGADGASAALAARNTSDVWCVVCGREYTPGDGNTPNVLTIDGELGQPVIQLACQDCHPSQNTGIPGRRRNPPRNVVLLGERDHAVAAMLLWEPYSVRMIADQSAEAESYRALGLQSGLMKLTELDQPRVDTLVVRVLGTSVVIELTDKGLDRLIAHQQQWLEEMWLVQPTPAEDLKAVIGSCSVGSLNLN